MKASGPPVTLECGAWMWRAWKLHMTSDQATSIINNYIIYCACILQIDHLIDILNPSVPVLFMAKNPAPPRVPEPIPFLGPI